MLTLLQKYLYRQSQYSNTWDSKCLALIVQMIRAFGMNPKVGGSSPPQVEGDSLNFRHFHKNIVRESKMNAVFRAQLTFQMLTLLQKYLSLFDVDVITYPCPNSMLVWVISVGKRGPMRVSLSCIYHLLFVMVFRHCIKWVEGVNWLALYLNSNVTRASWRLKSLANELFVQLFVYSDVQQRNIK